jgi:nondiscriminating glutamyl-tRNA synthetase
LSKRHGASSVDELRTAGFLPGAVVNYLLLLGWSHPEEKEKLTRDEMIESFSLGRVNKSAAIYDPKKLTWMNGLYIRDLTLDEWVGVATPFLPEAITSRFGEDDQREILDILHEKVETLDQLAAQTAIFLDDVECEDEAKEVLGQESSREVLAALAKEFDSMADDWSPDNIKAAVKKIGKDTGHKGKELFFPVRAAVTGNLHGPDLARVTAVKGKPAVMKLIEKAAGA